MTTRRRAVFVTLAVLGIFSGCGDDSYSESRLIDQVCKNGACISEGSARETAGLTADSIGFEIGPGPGSVVFPLPPDLAPAFSSYTVEVLIQGEGSTSNTSLVPDYAWRPADTSDAASAKPTSAKVVVTDASHAKIVDLRLVRAPESLACSVSAPGLRLHRRGR